MGKRIFVMNLGSTSTKLAIFDDRELVFETSIKHSQEDVDKFEDYWDQYDWRKGLIKETLEKNNIDPSTIDAFACRGGLVPAPKEGLVKAGAYKINEDLKYSLKYHPTDPHPVNMGVTLADDLAKEWGCPAYVYDVPTIDEMLPLCKVTGQPEMQKIGQGHPLNERSAAMKYAEMIGKKYEDVTVAVVHLGGGISITLHKDGKMIDCITDDEGPMCPERSGGLPGFQLIKKMGDNGWNTRQGLMYTKSGGLKAYLGTNDMLEVENRCLAGDEKAIFYYKAMAFNVAKNLAKISVTVCGEVDQLILTGALARSPIFCEWVEQYCGWVAPITLIPGDNEVEALAMGVLRVINGEEEAMDYVMQDWND